jgi:predicted  nucleic acid-binding Zn-ribbon protein|tara:strand:- start:385 stop:759 length:375 start_codon:yes stop_codon:yes gene_type:complete
MDDQVKLAILEQKVDDLKPIIHKLDATIEKLSEVNTTVSRMLAVHEERLSKSEEIDSVLFAKIDELRDKMDSDHHSVLSRIQDLEKKVWVGIGCVVAVSIIIQTGWIDLTPKPVTGTIVSSYSE